MANTTIVIEGIDNLEANLIHFYEKFGAVAQEVIREEAFQLKEESQLEVPVLTGALRDSAYAEAVESSPGVVTYAVGYGGRHSQTGARGTSTSSYALAVHEILSAIHPNGKAKFLEDPLNRYKAKAEQSMAKRFQALNL